MGVHVLGKVVGKGWLVASAHCNPKGHSLSAAARLINLSAHGKLRIGTLWSTSTDLPSSGLSFSLNREFHVFSIPVITTENTIRRTTAGGAILQLSKRDGAPKQRPRQSLTNCFTLSTTSIALLSCTGTRSWRRVDSRSLSCQIYICMEYTGLVWDRFLSSRNIAHSDLQRSIPGPSGFLLVTKSYALSVRETPMMIGWYVTSGAFLPASLT